MRSVNFFIFTKFVLILITALWVESQFFVIIAFLQQLGLSFNNAYALTTLPGTILHELAHYIVALCFSADPGNFNIIPDGENLGSVTFYPTSVNAASVALAPFLLAPLVLKLAIVGARANSILFIGGIIYVCACAWTACLPSSPDWQIALSYPTSLPIAGAMLLLQVIIGCFMVFQLLRTKS